MRFVPDSEAEVGEMSSVKQRGKKWQVIATKIGFQVFIGAFGTASEARAAGALSDRKVRETESLSEFRAWVDAYRLSRGGNVTRRTSEIVDSRKGFLLVSILEFKTGKSLAFAKISKRDEPLVAGYRWCLNENGYTYTKAARLHGGRCVFMHRLILGLAPGERGVEADHKNRDRLDNRRGNRQNYRVVSSILSRR